MIPDDFYQAAGFEKQPDQVYLYIMTESYPKAYLYRRVVQAKQFIDQHFAEPLNLDNIATEAHFSKYHFIRLFHRIYGQTPRQYLIQLRISKAKQILEKQESVEAACFLVGFDSVPTFSSLFKKRTGDTPSKYQQQYLALKAHREAWPEKYIPACHMIAFAGE